LHTTVILIAKVHPS